MTLYITQIRHISEWKEFNFRNETRYSGTGSLDKYNQREREIQSRRLFIFKYV